MRKYPLFILFILISFMLQAQITDVVILNKSETDRLKKLIQENKSAQKHYEGIRDLANQYLNQIPHPAKELFYEGLLDTNPKRIATQKCLEDIDKVVYLMYAYYGNNQANYATQSKDIILAWASVYQPTANPINENKLVPLFWGYYLFKTYFSTNEKKTIEAWMNEIAKGEMTRPNTPNNNWEAKRHKIIGTIGCILNNLHLINYAVEGFKTYINTAYFEDGTSNDLKQRDALHYHIGGLKPTIAMFVNCTPLHASFDLFNYVSSNQSSIVKSVEYTWPYANGSQSRKEWTNSQVKLDKERAAAGLAEYQPGKRFDPKDALPLFEWACFYDKKWYAVFGKDNAKDNYTATWIGMLNSPLVRK